MEQLPGETELRLLSPAVTSIIINFFDGDDQVFSLFMGHIPKDLETPNCAELRFSSSDIDAIRLHANNQNPRESPFRILFEEWGTMGTNRPKLKHLVKLLTKCQLFRASEYIARMTIGEPLPERPMTGPAAQVDISLPSELENMINGMAYPFSVDNVNKNRPGSKLAVNSPMENFPQNSKSTNETMTMEGKAGNEKSGNEEAGTKMPYIGPPKLNPSPPRSVSDLIKFSKTVTPSQQLIPAFSKLQSNAPDSSSHSQVQSSQQEVNTPVNGHESNFLPVVLENSNAFQSNELPHISAMLRVEETDNNAMVRGAEPEGRSLNAETSPNDSDSDE